MKGKILLVISSFIYKDFDSSSSKIQLRLPRTGVYTVEVRGINSNAEGEYTLAIAEQR